MLIRYNDIDIEMSDYWSGKDFTNRSALEIQNSINIYGSCFAQDCLTQVFPSGMSSVTFFNCNLTNCIIPSGNTVIGGTV